MEESNFLIKLGAKRELRLVEPSDEICRSYLEKSENCLKAAKLLLGHDLYENSIAMSYYAMYDSLTALLFKIGVKCENHSGSILLLEKLFERRELFDVISFAKKQRIDKQYYIITQKEFGAIKDDTETMVKKAEEFRIQIGIIIGKISLNEIAMLREKLKKTL